MLRGVSIHTVGRGEGRGGTCGVSLEAGQFQVYLDPYVYIVCVKHYNFSWLEHTMYKIFYSAPGLGKNIYI